MIEKIISGGQTGIDRLELEVAKTLKINTGGTVPKGYRTENGNDYSLRGFGLVEDSSYYYNNRTELNVQDSDGTLLFGDMTSSGSKLTISLLKKHNKPYIENPTPEELNEFIKNNSITILNVAGNRRSKLSDKEYNGYVFVLTEALKLQKQNV